MKCYLFLLFLLVNTVTAEKKQESLHVDNIPVREFTINEQLGLSFSDVKPYEESKEIDAFKTLQFVPQGVASWTLSLKTTDGNLSPEEAREQDLEKIAKMSANPLGSLWMLWLQNDTRKLDGDAIHGEKTISSTKFQPVMAIPFKYDNEDWNLILRPVIQYHSVPIDKDAGKLFGVNQESIVNSPGLSQIAGSAVDGRTEGFGDTALLTLVGPSKLDGAVWGLGLSQIFPTAEEDVLGQGKWQAGPAFLIANFAPDVGGFNVGALGQHWWSYAGDGDRRSTSMSDLQYFINYRLSKTELVGMSPNIKYDWEAESDDALTLPIGLGYSNVIKIGPMPLRFAAEIQYNVIRPDSIGSDINFRLMIIPIIPNPFAN
jgi:hypothetical protein